MQKFTGYYFYKNGTFIEGEGQARDYCRFHHNISLESATKKELCTPGVWSLDEISILLELTPEEICNRGILKNVKISDKEFAKPKNTVKTINAMDLPYYNRDAIDNYKNILKKKIAEAMKEPKALLKELYKQRDEANSEIQSRSILNQIISVESELTAYNEVINMIKI